MSSYLTSQTLIDSVKRRASIPASQATFQDEDFLAFANEELQIGLLPAVLQFHEEYLVYPLEVALVNNQSNYEIPDRSVGNKFRTLMYKDSPTGNLREMVRIDPQDIAWFENRSSSNFYVMYYLQGNNVVLVPSVTQAIGSLVFTYYMRPNQLVTADRIATVQSINTSTGDIVVDQVPSVFSVNTPVDFMEVTNGHRTRAIDTHPAAVNAASRIITFSPAVIPSDLKVGDHITLSGECFVPQIPDELHSILAQRVAARCLESLGDQQGLSSANSKLQEMEIKMGNLIDNRSEGNPQKINNLRGLLRSGKLSRRRNIW